MKTDNYYLKKITNKLGGVYNTHKTNNFYLRQISERISGGGAGNLDFIELVITYEDTTTETVNFAILNDDDGE